MKLHRNLVIGVINSLNEILLQHKQADTIVEFILQSNKTWGARDRNFIAESIYGTIRYKRLYEYCAGVEANSEEALWKIFAARLVLNGFTLPAWPEVQGLNADEINNRNTEAQELPKIRESIPDWLDDLGRAELGAEWDTQIHALNQPAKLCLRVNTLKASKSTIMQVLNSEAVTFTENEIAPDALIIEGRKNLRKVEAYKYGLFEIQDVSSQQVALMMDLWSGMMVIDGCCGAGGKTLHMAAIMKNDGDILAIDVNERKLEELTMRSKKAGCTIITTLKGEELTPGKESRLWDSADRILLDVPCSGLGVLRRKPDAKWSLTPQFIEHIKTTQSALLDKYAPMLRHGGIMVYSTCSILPSENEQQVKNFLTRNTKFELLEEKRMWPAQSGFDGFYMAKLARKPV